MKVNLLEKLLATKPKVGEVTFIAVDGHGGSGKSTLAKLLSEKLDAEIIHTDDFATWNDSLNWYPKVIKEVFEPIANGTKRLSYQPTSWWENHQPKPVVNQHVSDIMILEGVSSSRREFQDYISFSIFVDTPKDICLQRGLERDSGTGKSKEEMMEIWEKWFEQENEYMQRDKPRANANLVIDGTRSFSEQIEFVT